MTEIAESPISGHGPSSIAGVRRWMSAICRSITTCRRTGACTHHVAVGRDDPGDAVRGGDDDVAAGLDGTQAGHRELLVDLAGAGVGRVVGRHHDQVCPVVHQVAQQPVVRDLEAHQHARPRRADLQHTRTLAPDHVVGDLVERLHAGREQRPQRDVLAEGNRVDLVVELAGLPVLGPYDRAVVPAGVRAVPHDRSHEQRCPDCRGGITDRGPCGVVGVRVDVRGVLRPDHQVRPRRLPRVNLGREPVGGRHVVVEHHAPLRERLQTLAGDVALHRRHGDLPVAGGRRLPGPDGRSRRHDAGRDHRGHRPHRGTTDVQHAPGDRRAEQGDQERDARGPDVGERGHQRRVLDRERQPPPGEASERHQRPQRLQQRPRARRPERPERQLHGPPRHRCGRQPGDAVEQRLDQRQGQPCVDPDHPHPRQQHQHERGAEHEPEPEPAPQPTPHAQQGQRRDRERQQVHPVQRLEREACRHAGECRHERGSQPAESAPLARGALTRGMRRLGDPTRGLRVLRRRDHSRPDPVTRC